MPLQRRASGFISGSCALGLPVLRCSSFLERGFVPSALRFGGCPKIFVHCFMDGRDVPPTSGKDFVAQMKETGAAIGTISAEIIVCLSQSVLVMRKIPMKECISQFIMFVPVGIVMFVGVYQTSKLLDINISSLFIQVIAGVVIYGIFSLIFLYFIKDEIFVKFLHNLKKKLGKGVKL